MTSFNFIYANLLLQAMEAHVDELTWENIRVLQALYEMKSVAVSDFEEAAPAYFQKINEVNFKLEQALAGALYSDPLVVKIDDNFNVIYNIADVPIKFKVDPSVVTSVIDVENLEWTFGESQRWQLEGAYREYLIHFSDEEPLTQNILRQLPQPFKQLSFGHVLHFNMISDGEINHEILTPRSVVGLFNPKNKAGVRLGLCPVIELPIEGPGFNAGSVYPFALALHNKKTKHSLVGRQQLVQAGMSIVFDNRDTRIVDINKVDFKAVGNVLQPYMN